MSERKCIHGRSWKQACVACREYEEMRGDPEWQRRIEARPDVWIYQTDETGELVYAVSMDDDYWFNAFSTKKQAEAFCMRHKLSWRDR